MNISHEKGTQNVNNTKTLCICPCLMLTCWPVITPLLLWNIIFVITPVLVEFEAYRWICLWMWASSPQAGKWSDSRPAPQTGRCRYRWGSWWCLRTGGQWLRTGCTGSRWRGRTGSAVGTRQNTGQSWKPWELWRSLYKTNTNVDAVNRFF